MEGTGSLSPLRKKCGERLSKIYEQYQDEKELKTQGVSRYFHKLLCRHFL